MAVAAASGTVLLANGSGHGGIGPVQGAPLSPDAYRAQIVAVDAVLFEDGPLSEGDRTAVADHLVSMGRLAAVDTSNTIAVTLGQNMRTLSSMARHTKVGTPLLGSQLRQQWLRIRGSLFDDAWWFRRSSTDSVQPAVAGPLPPSALRPATDAERTGLDQALYSLGLLLDRARRDLFNDIDGETHRQFVTDLLGETVLDSARVGPQPPRYGIDVNYQSAHGHVVEAMRDLNLLARLDAGTPQSSREYLVSKAEERLGAAREARERMAM